MRTQQVADNIVYHLTRDPAYSKTSITDAAAFFGIPDLPAVISDFITRITNNVNTNGFVVLCPER